jgi:hypothetical protein
MQTRSFVGMDVHKATISISVAEYGRSEPVRFIGVIPNTPEAVHKMAKQLARHGELEFCYEASGCGYGIHRLLTALGHKCTVAAPSMIPRKPGERIKTDRRDSEKLAILHRSGDLTAVWVQTPRMKRFETWSGHGWMHRCTSCERASSCSPSFSERRNPNLFMGIYGGTRDGNPECRCNYRRWINGWERTGHRRVCSPYS